MDYVRLHLDDIRALAIALAPQVAVEVVRLMRQLENEHLDQAHLVRTTTPQQRNAMYREERRREDAEQKAKEKPP